MVRLRTTEFRGKVSGCFSIHQAVDFESEERQTMSVRNDRAAAVEQAGKQPPLLDGCNAWEQDGIRIQRQKDKRGNRSKASSEIECHCRLRRAG